MAVSLYNFHVVVHYGWDGIAMHGSDLYESAEDARAVIDAYRSANPKSAWKLEVMGFSSYLSQRDHDQYQFGASSN